MMPKSKTKFQEKWLSEIDPSGHHYSLWCRKDSDEYHVYCFICRKEFRCDKSGQLQLKQHSETQTHQKNSKSALSSSQSKLVVTKSHIDTCQFMLQIIYTTPSSLLLNNLTLHVRLIHLLNSENRGINITGIFENLNLIEH